ncbi:MAG: glycoside hydrolase family 20 zincin-like fold domain-containing protein [Bryobacterales bacterium]|nr:glycoside hydrolase family 20 zincin-like fold domain-containing protein [Bryobacterales bacterium]
MNRALLLLCCSASALALDLTRATVVVSHGLGSLEQKAAAVLVEEVEKRSQVRWPVATSRPRGGAPVVLLARGSGPPEGFRITTDGPTVTVTGNDARGVFYGVGRLLSALRIRRHGVELPDGFHVATAPRYRLRGHQLGYRPKTNSYDGFTVAMWDQYLRELALFGANAVELIPPRSDDAADSPHFPLPPMHMMVEMSRLADSYGLDVWIWYPALDKDYSDPNTVAFALKEWGEVFRQLPRIDAVFVPGGDPGHTQPRHLMALLEKQTANLRRYHPKATMWVSPQGFSQAWMEEFLGILRDEQPAWLAGVVFGPQIRMSLPELRRAVPERYPIRYYPDITHSLRCQYPVPDWDTAYAVTEGRETINPRPRDQAAIFRLLAPYTVGFLTYSEGVNDDVNKFVWSGLGWDPDRPVIEILRDYSRFFIGEPFTESFAQGLLALERNWRGPLATNSGVYTTLEQFQAMERAAPPQLLANWRFQQALYRAYYDAYTRRRLLYETELEEKAMEALREARALGSLAAVGRAEALLDQAASKPPAPAWRARIFELAEALFQSIRMQLSVPRYQAIAVDRGANLDTVDVPLNNRLWLKDRFAEIRALADEAARLRAIEEILNWSNPGPGGFYDDLGNPARQPHLVRTKSYEADPAFLESPLVGFTYRPGWRKSWWDHAEALNDQPLTLRYDNLDPTARYKIRVVYAGDSPTRKIRLVANDRFEIHPLIEKPAPVRPIEFEIPREATAAGTLELRWYRELGLGGNGRGCQVAEVWLIRQEK